jgi:hypothetical protein
MEEITLVPRQGAHAPYIPVQLLISIDQNKIINEYSAERTKEGRSFSPMVPTVWDWDLLSNE